MKIILDAMGGDNAPEAAVLGAFDAAKTFGTEIILVGRGEAILEVMGRHGISEKVAGMGNRNRSDSTISPKPAMAEASKEMPCEKARFSS